MNKGQVVFYAEQDAITLNEIDGRAFWNLQIFLCDLIAQIDVPTPTLMPLTEPLVEKGGHDRMADQPNAAFRTSCAADMQRPAEVLAAARRGEGLAARHQGLALVAFGDAESALTVRSEEHRSEVHLGGITALGGLGLQDNLAATAASWVA